jgi:hypothetical protein
MKAGNVHLLLLAPLLALGSLLHASNALAIPGTGIHSYYPSHTEPVLDSAMAASTRCRHEMASDLDVDDVAATSPCLDTTNPAQKFSIQLGRRIGDSSEILGEFDGARLDYRLHSGLKLNGIAGYELQSTDGALSLTRQVYGISAETEPSVRTWDLGSYILEQQQDGQLLERSTGGAIRYMQASRSLRVYADYDVTNAAPGTLLASGAWQFAHRVTVSATLDRQRRPIPLRQQAYLQHSMAMTEGWNWALPDERLTQLADSGYHQPVNILAGSLSRALSRRIRLSGDVVMLDATGSTDSLNPVASNETFYHLKLSTRDLLIRGDHSKLDLTRSITGSASTSTAVLDTRIPLRHSLKLASQLRADYINPATDGKPHWVATPKLAMEYRPGKQYGVQLEAGGKLLSGDKAAADASLPAYFVSLGYTVNF